MSTSVIKTPSERNETPQRFTPEMQQDIDKGAKELVRLWTDGVVQARYRIEVMLTETRRVYGESTGLLEVWSASSALQGNGDTRIPLCPGRHLKRNSCRAALTTQETHRVIACPKCGMAWKGSEVIEGTIYRATMEQWAHIVYGYYGELGHNADMVLSYHPVDIARVYTTAETAIKQRDATEHARRVRRRCIYPLKNFVHDVGTGADPLKRIQAFLTAD